MEVVNLFKYNFLMMLWSKASDIHTPYVIEKQRRVHRTKQNSRVWMLPKIGVPQNGWFIMETLIKMDDLGVPLFLETPI